MLWEVKFTVKIAFGTSIGFLVHSVDTYYDLGYLWFITKKKMSP